MSAVLNFYGSMRDIRRLALFAVVILLMPLWLKPFGAAYPDLLQKFAIFGVFAIGFNLFFGLTGYLSFGHAVFLGVGSYAAVWTFKLLTVNVLPAIIFGTLMSGIFALVIGYVCLRRAGIYFSILTLALAQMCYSLAYSVLTPITNGETALQMEAGDVRILDSWLVPYESEGLPSTHLFGLDMTGYSGFYFCAIILIAAFGFSQLIFNSAFGLQLRAIKSNQTRMHYTGYNPRPYLLAAFLISGMYAGLAGTMMAVIDPLAGAERMQWTVSGEVVLMTILGGVGTLFGPMLGVGVIKYFENIFSAINHEALLESFSFLPDGMASFFAAIVSPFVGEGWHLTLGVLFMMIVIFLPGGIIEGVERLQRFFVRRKAADVDVSGDGSGAQEKTEAPA